MTPGMGVVNSDPTLKVCSVKDIQESYRALLAVTNVLNSQRDTDSLWRAITEHIGQVVPWERAGITLYHPESDSFRFYAVETSLPYQGSSAGCGHSARGKRSGMGL